MPDLSDFGAGITDESAEEAAADEDDGETYDYERCRAIADETGERCENPRHHMSASKLCAPHNRAEDVTTIDDVEEGS